MSAIFAACLLVGDSCCAGCNSPSLLCFFVELLHLTFCDSFCIAVLSSHSSCRELFGSLFPNYLLSLLFFPAFYHLSTSPLGAMLRLHPTRLCPIIIEMNNHFPNFTKVHRTLGCPLILFLAFSSLFLAASFAKKLSANFCTSSTTSFACTFSFTFLPLIFLPFPFLCVHFSSWTLFLLFHPYSTLERWGSRGPLPGGFCQKFLGPFPGCFFSFRLHCSSTPFPCDSSSSCQMGE